MQDIRIIITGMALLLSLGLYDGTDDLSKGYGAVAAIDAREAFDSVYDVDTAPHKPQIVVAGATATINKTASPSPRFSSISSSMALNGDRLQLGILSGDECKALPAATITAGDSLINIPHLDALPHNSTIALDAKAKPAANGTVFSGLVDGPVVAWLEFSGGTARATHAGNDAVEFHPSGKTAITPQSIEIRQKKSMATCLLVSPFDGGTAVAIRFAPNNPVVIAFHNDMEMGSDAEARIPGVSFDFERFYSVLSAGSKPTFPALPYAFRKPSGGHEDGSNQRGGEANSDTGVNCGPASIP
jgi:hypothetical protein